MIAAHDRASGAAGLVRQSGLTSVTAGLSIMSGLLLDAAIAARFGTGTESDAFFVAARIPTGLTAIVLSSAAQTLVPSFSLWLVRKGQAQASRSISLVLTAVLLISAAVSLVGVATAGAITRVAAPGLSPEGAEIASSLAQTLFAIVPLGAAAEVLRAMMNAHRASVLPAAMRVAMNGTAAVLILAFSDGNIGRVAQAYVVGAVAQLLFMIVLAYRRGFRYEPAWPFRAPEVRGVGSLAVRPLASSGVQLGTRLGEQFLVSFLPAGSITILAYGNRLVNAIGGGVFFRSVIMGLLPRLTEAAANEDQRAFERTTRAATRIMLAISVPLTAFMVALAQPAAVLVFRRGRFSAADADLLGLVLAVYSAGLIGAALQRVFLSTFLARLETRVQLRNTVYGAIVNLGLIIPFALVLGLDDARAVLAVPVAYGCAQLVNVAHAWVRMRSDLSISLAVVGSFGLRLIVASLVALGAMTFTSEVVDLYGVAGRVELGLRAMAVALVGAAALGVAIAAFFGADIRRSFSARRSRGIVATLGNRTHDSSWEGMPDAAHSCDGHPERHTWSGSKVVRAVGMARQQGFRGCVYLMYAVWLEPLLMKPFPLYIRARRLALERWRRKTTRARLAEWRSRRDELVEGGNVGSPADLLLDVGQLRLLRRAAGEGDEIVLADIDQDGFLCSRVGPLNGVPTVPPDRFVPRVRFDLTLVELQGRLGVKKHFRGDVVAFLAELEASHDLREADCGVPGILGVDFEELTITFEFVPGRVLREELARNGALLRDRDVATHPSYQRLSRREARAKRIEEGRNALENVLDAREIDQLFFELKKVHAAGYVLHDIKFGNVILEPSGKPRLIDFDRARAYPGLGRLAFRFLRDRDYERFNVHFGTNKLTHRRARGSMRRLRHTYAPLYIEGGLRSGAIWNTDVGYGRWRHILRDNLPPLIDARVLDLGANNGFNAIQMMRLGAREVVAIEANEGAVEQAALVKDLFEWADNRVYRLTYVRDSMARLPQLDLGPFDLVTAFCSIYYLDDEEIATLVRHVSTITETLVLQCNIDRSIHRADPRTYEKASVGFALRMMQSNGFPLARVVAPSGYRRPLVIGGRGS